MLAARDQENLVHGHQTAAASKSLNQGTKGLQPKTPGNRYPKTPLKIPLQDENGPAGFGGKSVLGVKDKGLENLIAGRKKGTIFDKNNFVTPLGPRTTRAPLGMKTTNAKTKAFQTPAGPVLSQDLDKTQPKQTSARRPKQKVSHAEIVKLEIRGNDAGPLEVREVEYAPPKPKDRPYESEDFPNNCLNYDVLKPENLMRGWFDHYYAQVDENGLSKSEKEFEESLAKALKEGDERVLKALKEDTWTVGDVPETFPDLGENPEVQTRSKAVGQIKKSTLMYDKGLATVASRKAASALSVAPKTSVIPVKTKQPRSTASFLARGKKDVVPAPTNSSAMRHTAAAAASRSTIGYTKGRSASSVINKTSRNLPRSISNLSHASDSTITPARFAQKSAEVGNDEWRRLKFLGAFDTDDEDLEPCLRGALPECLRRHDDSEEEFVMTLGS